MQPRAVLLILLLLILVAVSGFWLWGRLTEGGAPSRVATATMPPRTPTVAETATPTAAPPPGYRLAGVAVGEPESFVVIEAPNGSTNLYRLHDDVPGLGELVRIEAERIVVRGAAAQFELWLTPAATATAAPAGTPKARSPTRTPLLRPRGGGTVAAPKSSGALDRPAS